jgi:hypothetical protein
MLKVETIAWDIDDVLNDLARAWFELAWLPKHPECPLTYHELKVNPPHKLLGVSSEECLASLDQFRLSAKAASMAPEEGLLEWFVEYGERYRHIAVTARPRETVYPAVRWVLDHFGEWFQTFAFVPSQRPGQVSRQPDRSKHDYLAWLGKVDYFIDDSTENCLAAEKLSIKSFLVTQPWNQSNLRLTDILKLITPSRSSHPHGRKGAGNEAE